MDSEKDIYGNDLNFNTNVRQQCVFAMKKSIYYFFLMVFTYTMMLVLMTFNGYIFMAAILGHAIGFYIFAMPNEAKYRDKSTVPNRVEKQQR